MISITSNEKQRALIALQGLCGLRCGEALEVKPSHFNMMEQTLHVHGKGDKGRIVPVSMEAWSVLTLPISRAFLENNREVVSLKDRFARRVITELGVKAGLKRHISSHDLRATFATAVFDATLDIRVVQELMGHSSIEQTQLYTGVTMNKMRGAVEL